MSHLPPGSSTDAAPLRVLLIDDDEASFHVVRGFLKKARDVRFEVEWLDSSDAALDEVLGQRHDVYLVDFRLGAPPHNGIDLIREAHAAACAAPMILLTGHGDYDVDREATLAGAADYLDKTDLTPALLERSIRFALQRAQEFRLLRESEMRFRALADAAPVLIWMVNAARARTFVNAGWLEFTGQRLEQEIGDGWTGGVHADDVEALQATFGAAFERREHFSSEYRMRRADGAFRWMLDNGAPWVDPDGTFIGYVGTSVDVTAQKETVETLRAAAEALEAQVLERTLALTQANEALEAENAERTSAERELARLNAELAGFVERLERSNGELAEFASIASHDLQEPLRKVQTFAKMARENAGDDLNDEARDALERVLAAAARMRILIDDLLALARVTTKKRPFAPVDLSRTAGEVLADLQSRLAETGGRVDVGELGTIEADPTQMHQLLQNLIGNAIKFHRPDQAPAIVIRGDVLPGQGPGAAPGEDRLRLTITDQGIGFDEKYVERIFGAFQRLHGRSQYEGTGIGLAICKKIAERHGGQITASSAPGEGTSFVVTLPVRRRREDTA